MTCTLIVLAHPERLSFNGNWADATEHALTASGHSVIWSDLYSMNFDPVERPSHYTGQACECPFDVLRAQEVAAATGALPADAAAEIAKIQTADRIIFHFPIWWFSLPAMLKGWCDRVLANGALHSASARFDSGLCHGKKALFCVTTGSTAAESAHNGKEGDVQMLLWPFAYTLRYLGFTVLEPRIVHGVHSYHRGQARAALQTRLRREIEAQTQVIARFDMLARLCFNSDAEFNDNGSLNSAATSHSQFIRHSP